VLHKFPLTKPLADKFRENVSGSKDGRPEWVNTIAIGSGPGLFGPGSAVWQVHGCIATVARTAEVVSFILNPPFNGAGKFFYKVISNAAIATLDHHELNLLGLDKRSKIWLRISRIALDVFLAILGPEPPAMQVARQRIAKSN